MNSSSLSSATDSLSSSPSHTPLSHHSIIHTTLRQYMSKNNNLNNNGNVNSIVDDADSTTELSTVSSSLSSGAESLKSLLNDRKSHQAMSLTKSMIYSLNGNHNRNDNSNDNNIIIKSPTTSSSLFDTLRARLLKSSSPFSSSLPSASSSPSSSSSTSPSSASSLFLDRLSNEVSDSSHASYSRDSLTPLFRFHRNATSPSSSSSSSSPSLSSPSQNDTWSDSWNNRLFPMNSSETGNDILGSNSTGDSDSSSSEEIMELGTTTTILPEAVDLQFDNSTGVVSGRESSPEFFSYNNLPLLFGYLGIILIVVMILVYLLCHFCDFFRRLRNGSDEISYGGRDHSSRSSLTSSEHHHHSCKHATTSSLYINNPNSLDLSCHESVGACPIAGNTSAAITRSLSVPGQQQTQIYGSQLSKNIVNYYESQQQQQNAQPANGKFAEPLPPNNSNISSTGKSKKKGKGADSPNGSINSDILSKHSYKLGGGLLLNDFIGGSSTGSEQSFFSAWPSTSEKFTSGASSSSANQYSTLQRINFSKTRRNRMRNDSAAAIALIKSGVFQHSKPRVANIPETGSRDLPSDFSATLPMTTGSRSSAQHFSDSLFDTWDTIPEVAFGGSSSSGILPPSSLGSSTGSGSRNGKLFTSGGRQSPADSSTPPQQQSQAGTSSSSSGGSQIKDLSPSAVNNDVDVDDSDEAIVVYNERTAL